MISGGTFSWPGLPVAEGELSLNWTARRERRIWPWEELKIKLWRHRELGEDREKKYTGREREREWETEVHTERERETEVHTKREREWETEVHTKRESERQKYIQREREREKEREGETKKKGAERRDNWQLKIESTYQLKSWLFTEMLSRQK